MDPNTLATHSTRLLSQVRTDDDPSETLETLETLEPTTLETLRTDHDAAKTFWLNVYNAFARLALERTPELYERKRAFFGGEWIPIAQTTVSLDTIEHGILRGSKSKYGFGYLPALRPSQFVRRHALSMLDYRIHFALNCGARSCPPIRAYQPSQIESQLELATDSYLSQEVTYDAATNVARVPRLLCWFRRDFGGRRGIYQLLDRYTDVPANVRPRVRYQSYDWTLTLDR